MSLFPVQGLRSVTLEVPSLDRAVAFYTGIWGLGLAGREAGRAWLHATGSDPHVLVLRQGERACIHDATFRAASEAALETLAGRVSDAGLTIRTPLGALSDDPAGGTGFAFVDPCGRLLRVLHGDRLRVADPVVSGLPDRLSHININSRDVDADVRFFEQVLGFRLTDRSGMMGFVRTNDDHHSVVIAKAPVDTLNHIAFNHPGWEGVMHASGRLRDNGHEIGWGPGRHGPGDNVFAYFVDPFGFVVEHTAEVLQVDDSYRVGAPSDWVWPAGRTDQWGIAPAKTEACKHAQLAIPFATQDA